jgi:hypothetical protein
LAQCNLFSWLATYLDTRGFFPHAYWYWIGVGGLVGFVFLFNMAFGVALAVLGPFDKPSATITEDSEDDSSTIQEVELPRIGELSDYMHIRYHS